MANGKALKSSIMMMMMIMTPDIMMLFVVVSVRMHQWRLAASRKPRVTYVPVGMSVELAFHGTPNARPTPNARRTPAR
jgi:hypothetical protein